VSVRAGKSVTDSVRLQGQWSREFEYFSPMPASEALVPTFAGEDIAFLNVTLYGTDDGHGLVLESVDAEISKAVEPGGTAWTTTERNRMKVAGFRKDRWSPAGAFSFSVDGTWLRRESAGTGSLADLAGDCRRDSSKKFHLAIDDGLRPELEAACEARFLQSTGEEADIEVTSVVGQARLNSKRTKIRVRIDVGGTAWGEFGSREFKLRIRSKGTRAD